MIGGDKVLLPVKENIIYLLLPVFTMSSISNSIKEENQKIVSVWASFVHRMWNKSK